MSTSSPDRPLPPASDVSAVVGLSGIAALALWILFCHFWPEIGLWLGVTQPQGRLSGPYAALVGLAAAALPMVVVSLVRDKVHLRTSTGIDWNHPRSIAAISDISITKLAGLWATWGIIGGLYCLARWYWDGPYLLAMDVLGVVAVPLVIASVPYVIWLDRLLVEPRDPAWHFGALLIGREPFDPALVEGTPVRAVRGGRVIYSDGLRGYGNIVIIEHDGGYATVYAHNRANRAAVGDTDAARRADSQQASTATAKRAFLSYLRGMPRERLAGYAHEFAEVCVPKWAYADLRAEILRHKHQHPDKRDGQFPDALLR